MSDYIIDLDDPETTATEQVLAVIRYLGGPAEILMYKSDGTSLTPNQTTKVYNNPTIKTIVDKIDHKSFLGCVTIITHLDTVVYVGIQDTRGLIPNLVLHHPYITLSDIDSYFNTYRKHQEYYNKCGVSRYTYSCSKYSVFKDYHTPMVVIAPNRKRGEDIYRILKKQHLNGVVRYVKSEAVYKVNVTDIKERTHTAMLHPNELTSWLGRL